MFAGELVTSTQHKSPFVNDQGWIVNDLMVLHDIPFAYKHLPCTITVADSSSLIGTNKLRMRGY